MSFPPKEHNITKPSHSDVGSWAWCHYTWWCGWLSMMSLLKRYKRMLTHGGEVPSSWFWENTGLNAKSQGASVHSHTGFARNTQIRGTACFSLLFFHDYVPLNDQALVLMTFICLGGHWESVPTPRRLKYHIARTTKPYWCWQRLQLLIGVYLFIHTAVTYIFYRNVSKYSTIDYVKMACKRSYKLEF